MSCGQSISRSYQRTKSAQAETKWGDKAKTPVIPPDKPLIVISSEIITKYQQSTASRKKDKRSNRDRRAAEGIVPAAVGDRQTIHRDSSAGRSTPSSLLSLNYNRTTPVANCFRTTAFARCPSAPRRISKLISCPSMGDSGSATSHGMSRLALTG